MDALLAATMAQADRETETQESLPEQGSGQAPGLVSPVSFTRHARRRGARRNLPPDTVDYVLTHGRVLQRTGVMFFFLGRRDIPPSDRGASWAARLEGTIVIASADGPIITVYRDRRGLRTIARKAKYRLRWHEQPSACAGAEDGSARIQIPVQLTVAV